MLSKLRSGRQVVRRSDENNEGLCKRTGRVGVDGPNTDLEPSQTRGPKKSGAGR